MKIASTISARRHLAAGAWALAGLFLTTLAGTAAAAPIPIRFRPGQHHARAVSRLRGIHDQALFVFSARSGQHVRVKITGQGPTRGVVTYPSGRQDGSPGGVVFDTTVNETGHYHLRVTESSMGTAWRGRVIVDVTRH